MAIFQRASILVTSAYTVRLGQPFQPRLTLLLSRIAGGDHCSVSPSSDSASQLFTHIAPEYDRWQDSVSHHFLRTAAHHDRKRNLDIIHNSSCNRSAWMHVIVDHEVVNLQHGSIGVESPARLSAYHTRDSRMPKLQRT
ncbi:hypothetical protein K503DRAFT_772275 [Rhizopogon vinicolor AM-OR11-026]|uniref:Uncharacterized protein n=1 Tax=Rhizopogon vinicolor AM-OR11-026 TaxID=1314800 RepID=A0A1B7MVQ1_9AGAM|nr:hypothetical protein K503DRAFT_772275 [Rhizopogon vinicolor AM-OR11-026]